MKYIIILVIFLSSCSNTNLSDTEKKFFENIIDDIETNDNWTFKYFRDDDYILTNGETKIIFDDIADNSYNTYVRITTNNGVYIEKRENEIIGASIVDDLVDIARRKIDELINQKLEDHTQGKNIGKTKYIQEGF